MRTANLCAGLTVYENHVIGVVVPAYNEEDHIGGVIRTMPRFVDRIYLIDDASTDSTWERALAAARDEEALTEIENEVRPSPIADGGNPALMTRARTHRPVGKVVPIRHRENRGAGGAVKTGYLAARQDDADIVVTMDGDGQMEPDRMPHLLDPIVQGKADYAKGNRLVYPEYRGEMPRFRFFGNAILTLLTKIASGYWKIMDPQNGYTAISEHALENLPIENLFEYYGYCNDLLVKLNAKAMRVADVPMPATYGEEQSSIQYSTYIPKVSSMLLGSFLWRLKRRYLVLDFHPLVFFYVIGAATAGGGVLGGCFALYGALVSGGSLLVSGSLSFIVFLIGTMFLLFAMVFDMYENEDRELQAYG